MAFRYRGKPEWLVPHPLAGMGDGATYGAAMIPTYVARGGGSRDVLGTIFSSPDPADPVSPPWEHVSVSARGRIPTWDEMCRMKALFWDDEDCVVQFHPPKSDYVNACRTCLHLWRWTGGDFPRPPKGLVG